MNDKNAAKAKKPTTFWKFMLYWIGGLALLFVLIGIYAAVTQPQRDSEEAAEARSARKASAASKAEEKKQAKKYNADNKLLEEKIKSTVSQNDDYLESVRFSGGSSSSHISLATITVKDDLLSYNKEQLQSYCNSLYEDLLLDIQSSGVGSCAVMLESEAGQSVAETNFSMTKLEVK